jgi:hypothetical protein
MTTGKRKHHGRSPGGKFLQIASVRAGIGKGPGLQYLPFSESANFDGLVNFPGFFHVLIYVFQVVSYCCPGDGNLSPLGDEGCISYKRFADLRRTV